MPHIYFLYALSNFRHYRGQLTGYFKVPVTTRRLNISGRVPIPYRIARGYYRPIN